LKIEEFIFSLTFTLPVIPKERTDAPLKQIFHFIGKLQSSDWNGHINIPSLLLLGNCDVKQRKSSQSH